MRHANRMLRSNSAARNNRHAVYAPLIQLQQSLGNRTTWSLLDKGCTSPPVQRVGVKCHKALQAKSITSGNKFFQTGISDGRLLQRLTTVNFGSTRTSTLPDSIINRMIMILGIDLSGVRVHHNAAQPAQINAMAYAQGDDIHLGPDQERHLPHEAWHVVQQMQCRVKPTAQRHGMAINDNPLLEREADQVARVISAPAMVPARPLSNLVQSDHWTAGNHSAASHHVGETIQLKDKTAFEEKGWKSTAYVKGSTASIIDQALAESKILKPYIKDKLKKTSIAGKKFVIHDSDAEFLSAYQKAYDVVIQTAGEKAFLHRTWGFYDPKKDKIHLRPKSRQAHALHEAIHKLSHFTGKISHFGGVFGSSGLNEGVTQYFTDRVLEEQGMSVSKSHNYQDQLACAKILVKNYGVDLVAKAYFLNDLALAKKVENPRDFVPDNCKDID